MNNIKNENMKRESYLCVYRIRLEWMNIMVRDKCDLCGMNDTLWWWASQAGR